MNEIEEMAKDMCGNGMKNGCCAMDDDPCTLECVYGYCAEKLYAKGYHKQSEGEWVDKPTGAYGRMQSYCTACGKHSGIGGIKSNRHKPFCPNCGARMKGENEKNV